MEDYPDKLFKLNAARKLLGEVALMSGIFLFWFTGNFFLHGCFMCEPAHLFLFTALVIFAPLLRYLSYLTYRKGAGDIVVGKLSLTGPGATHFSGKKTLLFKDLDPSSFTGKTAFDKLGIRTVVIDASGDVEIQICHFGFQQSRRQEILSSIQERL